MVKNERSNDLLISILLYDEVSVFLQCLKGGNLSLWTGRLICCNSSSMKFGLWQLCKLHCQVYLIAYE